MRLLPQQLSPEAFSCMTKRLLLLQDLAPRRPPVLTTEQRAAEVARIVALGDGDPAMRLSWCACIGAPATMNGPERSWTILKTLFSCMGSIASVMF